MKITFNDFSVFEWKQDTNVLNKHIDPENTFFELKIKDIISYVVTIDKVVDNPYLCFLNMQWMYQIQNDNQTKEYFNYTGIDINSVIMYDLENEREQILKMVKESFDRFSGYFESLKHELGLNEHHLEMDESEIDQTCLYVGLKLMNARK